MGLSAISLDLARMAKKLSSVDKLWSPGRVVKHQNCMLVFH